MQYDNAMGIDSGTTIIAVTFEGGVVLGADSRTSTGVYLDLPAPPFFFEWDPTGPWKCFL